MNKVLMWFLVVRVIVASEAPSSIPLGARLTEWVVTNGPISVNLYLQSTNSSGGLNTCGLSIRRAFSSSSEFSAFVVSKTGVLLNFMGILTNRSNVRFRVTTKSGEVGSQTIGIDSDLDLGLLGNHALETAGFTPNIASVSLRIPGLQSAKVQVGSGDFVQANVKASNLQLDNSLTSQATRIRLQITLDDGQVATYSQNGNRIEIPIVSMIDYGFDENGKRLYVSATGTVGADTVLESSNGTVWTPVATNKWDSPYGTIYQPTGTNEHEIFRARSF